MAEDCERTLLRRELIREVFEEERSISELSKRYGLSRKTIHSWKRRYEQEGLKAWNQRAVALIEVQERLSVGSGKKKFLNSNADAGVGVQRN
jgi:transposase-like protein